jgi:hypothetical protein
MTQLDSYHHLGSHLRARQFNGLLEVAPRVMSNAKKQLK